ncbi:GNAT family N-acetyltransferase [Ideonella livida]|uniref:GNAT family N-acetyltransferase n=1 Tax=Ideonella livida TaxID=2707176 RepID=A0A7C9TNR8_9BURK|nr:GNAT family N-acetyltransferase [Ideonella livida]NDY93845.1 GNAT family N-acetyltransferase [Ideonella livida]
MPSVHPLPTQAAPLFTTARLAVRRWQADDLAMLYTVYADPEAVRWVGDGQPITQAECERWLVVTANNYARRGYGMWAVTSRDSAEVLGFAGLVHPGGQAEPEVKYALRRACWGQGFASELLPALLRHGAQAHGLRQIIATVDPDNLASQRVLRKAGAVPGACREEDDGSRTLVFTWTAPSGVIPPAPAPVEPGWRGR